MAHTPDIGWSETKNYFVRKFLALHYDPFHKMKFCINIKSGNFNFLYRILTVPPACLQHMGLSLFGHRIPAF